MLTRPLALVVLLAGGSVATAQEESAGYEYQDRALVERTVEDVMARPEFRRLADIEDEESRNPAWLDRFLDWIESWLGQTAGAETPEGGFGSGIFSYGLAFLIVLAALAFIVKSVLESRRERELPDEPTRARITRADAAPGETSPSDFWRRAHDLAASGEHKLAVRELLLGAMSTLERGGKIRYRRGLTNRDYWWAAKGGARTSLGTIIDEFERIYFGRRDAGPDGFRACADAYRESFDVEVETA